MTETFTEEEMTVDEFLEHFGVLGMKWGRHKAVSTDGGAARPTRKDLHALNKASKKADADKHASEVDAARTNYSQNARKNYLNAKAQYKQDKVTIGKREALKAFNAVKDQNVRDYQKAQEYRDGKERTTAVMLAIGGVVLATAIRVAASN